MTQSDKLSSVPVIIAECVEVGLANRLKMMACLYSFARRTERRLQVIWEADSACPANAVDLFDLNPIPPGNRNGEYCPGLCFVTREQVRSAGSVWRSPRLPPGAFMRELLNRTEFEQRIVYAPGAADFALPGLEPADLLADKTSFFKILPIQGDILRTMSMELAKWGCVPGGQTVAVHVRRFDGEFDTRDGLDFDGFSPLDDFIRVMRAFPESVRMLIFSNSSDAIEMLCSAFPSSRLRQGRTDPPPARGTLEGIRQALVDFILVASCDAVIGSYFSSFSDEAAVAFKLSPRYCPLGVKGLRYAAGHEYHAVGYVLDPQSGVLHRDGDTAIMDRLLPHVS